MYENKSRFVYKEYFIERGNIMRICILNLSNTILYYSSNQQAKNTVYQRIQCSFQDNTTVLFTWFTFTWFTQQLIGSKH